jgi:probable F420-dependent oxidoreductase
VKFMTAVGMVNPSFYVPIARAAEAAGFDSVNVPDSICYPRVSDSKYPYTPDGSRDFLENKPFIEPLVAMAAMGASTERIQFHTSVLKLPIRHPVIFAKEITSLCALFANRVSLGVGTSPWPDDYEVVGLSWERRGKRFDECIDIIRGLETGDYFEYHGEFYDVPSIKMNPVPSSPIPILIGGHADAHVRRAARMGDGWIAAGMAQERLIVVIGQLNELRKEHGRDHLPFEIHATTADSFTPDGVARLEEMGVTHTMGGFGRFNPYGHDQDPESLQEKIDNLNRYAEQVIAKVRA